MSNAFDQFDASASPQGGNAFDQFDPPAPKQPPQTTSQSLGFTKGINTVFDNAAGAAHWAADQVPIPFTRSFSDPTQKGATLGSVIDQAGSAMGLPSAEHVQQADKQYVADQEAKGVHPGGWGELGGDVVGTIPLALTGMGPWSAGATAGGLTTDEKDPVGVLKDMAIGAVGGKAADLGVNALSKLAKPVIRSVASKLGTWAAPPIESAAPEVQGGVNYVERLLDSSGKSLDDLSASGTQAANKPLTAAEAIGPTGISAVSALARRQGATGEAAAAQLGERASGMRGRMLDDYAASSGIDPVAAQGNIDDLVASGRQAVKPLFDQALSVPGPIWNNDLQVLVKRPVIQKAIQGAMTDLQNADIHPGVLGLPSGPDDGQLLPTAQAWDLIRKNLAGQVERDNFGKILPDSVSRGNYNINQANRALTAQLRSAIPGYGDALDASGDYLGMQKAFENGQKLITSQTFSAENMAKQFAKLSDPEKEAFKGGIANQIFTKAQNNQLHPSFFRRPMVQSKLATVLGKDKAAAFLQNMEMEGRMAAAGARMAPGTNSVTGEVMNATGEQDKNWLGALISSLRAGTHAAHGNVPSAAAHTMSALRDMGIFTKASTMPVPVRDEAGRMLLMKPADLVNHLQTLYGAGDPAAVQRVTQFLSRLKAPARAILAPAAVQTANQGFGAH